MADLKKKFSEQAIDNSSFDEAFEITIIAGYGWDGTQWVPIKVDSQGVVQIT